MSKKKIKDSSSQMNEHVERKKEEEACTSERKQEEEAGTSGQASIASTSPIITDAIRREEEKLSKVTDAKEGEIKDAAKQAYRETNDDVKEARYQSLKLILEKSQIYTSFLCERLQSGHQKSALSKVSPKEQNTQSSTSSSPNNQGTSTRKRKRSSLLASRKKQKIDTNGNDKENAPEINNNANTKTADEMLMVEQPVLLTGGKLRDYQIKGFRWLQSLYENGVNGILADEMGLGKTIQCIATICALVEKKVRGPFLVVGPLSTVPNWCNEFKRFAPKIPVVLYHGTQQERRVLAREIRQVAKVTKDISVYPVVVTSYEIAMRDAKLIGGLEWSSLIIDEGHRIKNFKCKLIQELKRYICTYRILLTGTPLQNNLSELWSLLNFLLPEIFDNLASFEMWFDLEYLESKEVDQHLAEDEQGKSILSILHELLSPFMLRRLKSDVDLAVPPKKEVIVYAPLSELQMKLYKLAANRTIRKILMEEENPEQNKENVVDIDEKGRPRRKATQRKIDYSVMMSSQETDTHDGLKPGDSGQADDSDEDDDIEEWAQKIIDMQQKTFDSAEDLCAAQIATSAKNIKLSNVMMLLRKCCNHPYLLQYPLTPDGEYKIDEELVTTCGKLRLLDVLLKALKKDNHKVLLFSQMTKMLDILGDYIHHRGFHACRLDGTMSLDERREQIEEFKTDPDCSVFLLSTRAAGLGINLTAADTVIIYDSDWNPQADLQAQDRCHRIGQTVPVMVYRLVTSNTIDQKIVERAQAKRKLEKMVIRRDRFKTSRLHSNYKKDTAMEVISKEELLSLLRDEEYKEVGDGGEIISDEEVAKLLDRSELWAEWQKRQEEGADGKDDAEAILL